MITNKATAQFILSKLSRKEKDTYAKFLALPEEARKRLMGTQPLADREELLMREVAQKVEQLQATCETSVFKN